MKYRLREHRKAKGLTLDQLAAIVGSSKSYMSDIERGAKTGSVEMLRAIANALGISEGEIFAAETPADQALLDHIRLYQSLSEDDRKQIDALAFRLQKPAA